MWQSNAKRIALGGMLAAVALVIMCLGGLIPVATYVCPILCCMIAYMVFAFCGKRIAWAWYVAVSILALLMGPDKEAAVIFLFIGYFPLIKRVLERSRFSYVIKLLIFNASVLAAYALLIHLLGIAQIAEENAELGKYGVIILLALGNVTFLLLDRLLDIMQRKMR